MKSIYKSSANYVTAKKNHFMRFTLWSCILISFVLGVTGCATKSRSENERINIARTIVIDGQTTADDPTVSYEITLDTANKTWKAKEDSGTSEMFRTKSGKYIYSALPDDATLLRNEANIVTVVRLVHFKDSTSPVGATGTRCYSEETGRVGNWKRIQ